MVSYLNFLVAFCYAETLKEQNGVLFQDLPHYYLVIWREVF